MTQASRSFTRLFDRDKGAPVKIDCLDEFRHFPAYVLLGAPGSGKSTEFRQEAKRCCACFETARDFICLDRPEWATGTLFIDGLDEMRVGSQDPRMPLDQIRAKLNRLGVPKFRISCRDGGWLGTNDLESLKVLADGDDVPVFRLDPLGMEEIRKILKQRVDDDESQRILDGAIEQGLQGLLENPLTLRLLAEALPDSDWPQSRTEAITLACETLLTESNDEHLSATSRATSASELLRMAEQLCAFQLLTGSTGYSRVERPPGQDFLAPGELGEVDSYILNRALGSRVFESQDVPGRLAPVHRLVAEFLAARYLARLIGNGLPVRRVLSLVSGFDGRVVSEFSGVTAWLATLCSTGRCQIIERNPLGVLLLGEVKEFASHEKGALIQCVAKRPWRQDDYHRLVVNGDAGLDDLATPDMESVFRGFLQDPEDDVGLRAALLVLRSLQGRFEVRGLVPDLLRIVRNGQRHPQIRFQALKALCAQFAGNRHVATDLMDLLRDVADGRVYDEDDELLGLLLDSLYPSILSATDVVGFLRAPKARGLYGRYKSFWRGLPQRGMTTLQIGELLNALYAEMPNVRARLGGQELDRDVIRLPGSLLAQYLEEAHTESNHRQFYGWLELSFNYGFRIHAEQKKVIQDWLAGHPKDLKALVEHGIRRCLQAAPTQRRARRFCKILDRLDSPMELVGWLREQSLALSSPRIQMALRQLSERGIESCDRPDTVAAHEIEPEVQDTELAELVDESGLERPVGRQPSPIERAEEDQIEPWQEEWRARVREDLEEVRSSQCSPPLDNGLAHAYFGEWQLEGETPPEHLRTLLGDESLVDAALDGLRGVVDRIDVPTPDEIADFVKKDLVHPLARPFLAGMAEIKHAHKSPEQLLGPRQLRTALAFHFSTPFIDPEPYRADECYSDNRDTPPWYRHLLDSDPAIVAEVLVKMARAEISKGRVLIRVLHKLETSPDHKHVARLACLPLLRSIPVRLNSTQMDGLACLLRAAILHCERGSLLSLIDKKLGRSSMLAGQRVYWLTAGLFSPSVEYLEDLIRSLSMRETLIPSVVDFAVGSGPSPAWEPPLDELDPESLERLILSVGKLYSPVDIGTLRIEGPVFVEALIKHLSEKPSQQASHSLLRLSQSTALEPWRPRIQEGRLQQAAIRRSASFRYASTRQLRRTLGNLQPASAADLAALTSDHLETIAKRVRDGNTSDWRQYWDCERRKSPSKPKHEELCRDSLLSDLGLVLEPLGIDAQPEGVYADDKRADIRVAYGGFNVPVEIKKSTHPELWTSIRDQLAGKYTRDPGCDGYGVYVVLWFGADGVKSPPSGKRPRCGRDLKKALARSLTESERLRLSIVVIDLAKPSS